MNKRLLFAAAAVAGSLAFAGSASAVETVTVNGYTLDDTSFGTGLGVHSDGTQSGTTVSGEVNQDGSDVTFSSSDTLNLNGSGEAIVEGSPDFSDLMVVFEKSWGAITFNLEDNEAADDSTFVLSVNGGTAVFDGTAPGVNCTFCLVNNGENKFTVSGPGITSLAFTFTPDIGDAKQFRVEEVFTQPPVIPEPTTWAMMILGFGGVGAMVRRRRSALMATA